MGGLAQGIAGALWLASDWLTSDVDRHNTQQVPAQVDVADVLGLPPHGILGLTADHALAHHAQRTK